MNSTESLRRIIQQSINHEAFPNELQDLYWHSVAALLRSHVQTKMISVWTLSDDLKSCLLRTCKNYGTISAG
jgi:hypothetical protein